MGLVDPARELSISCAFQEISGARPSNTPFAGTVRDSWQGFTPMPSTVSPARKYVLPQTRPRCMSLRASHLDRVLETAAGLLLVAQAWCVSQCPLSGPEAIEAAHLGSAQLKSQAGVAPEHSDIGRLRATFRNLKALESAVPISVSLKAQEG